MMLLSQLPSLASLTLSHVKRPCVYSLLLLPALQRLDLRGCGMYMLSTRSERQEEFRRRSEEMARERGVELLWKHGDGSQ